VNIGYAALTMNADLGFDAQVFGMGAGIFFAGYFLFEIPGALVAERYSPRLWLARITVSWGVISGLMAFMHACSFSRSGSRLPRLAPARSTSTRAS
jgi:hypothetical protein